MTERVMKWEKEPTNPFLLALKEEEAYRSWKWAMDSLPMSLQKGQQPCDSLVLASRDPRQTSELQILWDNKPVLFLATPLVVIYCSGDKKPIQLYQSFWRWFALSDTASP